MRRQGGGVQVSERWRHGCISPHLAGKNSSLPLRCNATNMMCISRYGYMRPHRHIIVRYGQLVSRSLKEIIIQACMTCWQVKRSDERSDGTQLSMHAMVSSWHWWHVLQVRPPHQDRVSLLLASSQGCLAVPDASAKANHMDLIQKGSGRGSG